MEFYCRVLRRLSSAASGALKRALGPVYDFFYRFLEKEDGNGGKANADRRGPFVTGDGPELGKL